MLTLPRVIPRIYVSVELWCGTVLHVPTYPILVLRSIVELKVYKDIKWVYAVKNI